MDFSLAEVVGVEMFGNTSQMLRIVNPDESITYIPMDEQNSDYQSYLVWVAEQDGK